MAARAARSRARKSAGLTGDLFAPRPAASPLAPVPAELPARQFVPRQLWLALGFPALSLVAARGEQTAAPFVVVAGEGPRRVVVAASPAALAAGIHVGQPLAVAEALVPELRLASHDPAADAGELARLAHWAMGLTPFVSLEAPAELLLEVQGSLRLFGGTAALIARARAGLAASGHEPALALAPTPRAALWLARGAAGSVVDSAALLAGHLARLPLAVCGWPAEALEDCARLGIGTLGELRRLPRDGLARRLGPALLAELDEAYGLRATPRRRHLVPERFAEHAELPAELVGSAELMPYCQLLLERLQAFLQRRAGGVTRIALLCKHHRRKPTCVIVGRALPAAASADWLALLGERLARVALPAPVLALGLRTGAVLALGAADTALPGLGRGELEAFALLDRLRARLGDEAVRSLGLVPEHRPEAAFRALRPEPGPLAARPPEALPPAPRPLWLLAAPAPLALEDGRPCHDGALALESGPERIESGWWDGGAVARDYYVARTRHGVRLWIFRTHGARRWFLHGVFG
jgi:protein ImuB